MRSFEIKYDLQKKFAKILKRDKNLYSSIQKKIGEISSASDLGHYKNLRYDMSDSKRVHIGHFVLVFSYDENQDMIIFEDFDHHDRIYS